MVSIFLMHYKPRFLFVVFLYEIIHQRIYYVAVTDIGLFALDLDYACCPKWVRPKSLIMPLDLRQVENSFL